MKKIILSVFALSILLPTLAFASFDTSLKYGSRGDAVIELQDFLQDQGVFTGKVDGRFGLGTRKSVIAFQLANGLQGDGYFGLGSRTKANSILALTLQPSTNAEQAETGTTTTASIVAGCTSNSAYSATTGQPCNSTTQPITPNLPVGCTSTSGFSVTTGQACNGVASTIQQLQQTVQQQAQTIQQIQQNTQQLVQNTTPVDICPNISGIQTYVPSGMTQDSSNNCITPYVYQPTKEIRIDNLPTTVTYYDDYGTSFNINPSFYIDGVKQTTYNYPFEVKLSDGTATYTKLFTAGTYTFNVTSTGFTPKTFDVTFVKKNYVEPTFTSEVAESGNYINVLLTSNSGAFTVQEMKVHLISNTISNSPWFSVGGISATPVNDVYYFTGLNLNVQDGQQIKIPLVWGGTSGKGSFQYEVTYIKYNMGSTMKTVNLNLASPVITIN